MTAQSQWFDEVHTSPGPWTLSGMTSNVCESNSLRQKPVAAWPTLLREAQVWPGPVRKMAWHFRDSVCFLLTHLAQLLTLSSNSLQLDLSCSIRSSFVGCEAGVVLSAGVQRDNKCPGCLADGAAPFGPRGVHQTVKVLPRRPYRRWRQRWRRRAKTAAPSKLSFRLSEWIVCWIRC